MNCPQCRAENGPDAGFCGRCGARLAVAESAASPAGYGPEAAGAPLGYNAPGGYNAPSGAPGGYNAPAGYNAPSGNAPSGNAPSGNAPSGNAPGGYGAPAGYNAPSGGAPGGYNAPSGNAPGGYGAPNGYNAAPGGQMPPSGYPQGQHQQPAPGGWQPPRSAGLPPVSFDLNRATTVDKVVAVATFITMISIWMPWYTVSYLGGHGSGSGTAAHGWLWLEFLLALVLIAYLVARVAWETLPISLPVAHAPILIVGTSVQLLLILIAFVAMPSTDGIAGVSVGWGFGAFLGVLAALVAAGPVVVPAVRSYLDSRKASQGAGPF